VPIQLSLNSRSKTNDEIVAQIDAIKPKFDEIALPNELEIVARAWFDAAISRKSPIEPMRYGHFMVSWMKLRGKMHEEPPKLPDVRTIFDRVAAGTLSADAGLAQISVVMRQIREEAFKAGLEKGTGIRKIGSES
jgi:hypothetical protein